MLAQVVAHALLKLVEHLCRPVAHAARIIYLVRIVEIITQIADVTSLEGFVEFREESQASLTREMIHYIAFTSRAGTFHEFAMISEEKCGK